MKRRPTKRSPEGQQAMQEFRDTWGNSPCWLCPYPGMEIHHIVKRRGLIFDDLRDFAWLCRWCHSRAEGNTVVLHRVRLLPISVETVLEAKRLIDPKHWDLEFLRLLAGPGDGRLNMAFGEGME
jgi:hypothetical protein